MEQFLSTETLVIELLLVVSLVAIAVRRLRIPYTVALVVVGLLITFQSSVRIDLTPELILALFVPPLIFEAAFHLDYRHLRTMITPILVLAIPGVIVTALIVGAVVSVGIGLSFPNALVFGALIAATDPVAVVALFRALGAPKRLAMTVAGESLFNDGTAIVIFNLVLGIALTLGAGSERQSAFNPLIALVDFVRVSLGGLVIGMGLGWVISLLIARVDDYLIETTLTTVLAFGAYLMAEHISVSGVLAVVAAGIVCGNVGPRGMSATTRIVLFSFWEYLAFIANSLVFLLIGLDVNIPQIAAHLGPISIAVLAVIMSRFVVVYGLSWVVNLRRATVPWRYQHVLFWGGLRGAVSLALVLSLPASFGDRELLRVMTFGVVLFTLLVQGTTMNLLLNRLGLIEREPVDLEYERRHGRVLALYAARNRLAEMQRMGMLSTSAWEHLSPDLEAQIRGAIAAQQALLSEQPTLRAEEVEDAHREGLRTQRATLTSLVSHGVISEAIYTELVAEVDADLDRQS